MNEWNPNMFKKLLLIAFVIAATVIGTVRESQADQSVRGYVRSSGTYVAPHYRSKADGNFRNNYSTRPNVNPYTGRIGTRSSPSYSSGYRRSR